ncbi:hypothetical protein PX52LOC_07027 [Limnoglobus roseus]|uniref:Uncharacterized protein n=1 Tax=Limnoglobus roseus TaxID=2598579 RepID=A0A5C1ART2_9BACT|nr:hypothetical protein PX52LOC_07027 [Limnoglobus roseus]
MPLGSRALLPSRSGSPVAQVNGSGWANRVHQHSPRNPTPQSGFRPASAITRPAPFFLRVLRVRAGDPVLGPLPPDARPGKDAPHPLGRRPAGRPPLRVAHAGRQGERPQARGPAELPRPAVDQILQAVVVLPVPDEGRGPGDRRLAAQAREPVGVGRPDGVADRLGGQADGRRTRPAGAGEQHLATTGGEPVGRFQPPPQGDSLAGRRVADQQGRCHPVNLGRPAAWQRGDLILH